MASAVLDPAARAAALEVVSSEERARHDATPSARRDAFLAGRALLRRLAGERLGVAPAEVPLVARCPDCGGPHGRPVIEGSALRVSLAHTADAVVAVAVWDRAVGVDAEPRDPPPARLEAIRAVAGGEGVAHWTRVEAVLKADGRGLRVDPREVRIRGDAATIGDDPTRYVLVEPDVDPTLHVAVALGGR